MPPAEGTPSAGGPRRASSRCPRSPASDPAESTRCCSPSVGLPPAVPKGTTTLQPLLGLDTATFDRELAKHVHAERVYEDVMSGVRSGVNGTPTYVNGRGDSPCDLETLRGVLDRAR